MAKTAVVNLVDLAGSERADSTGATGDRLKEVSFFYSHLNMYLAITLSNMIGIKYHSICIISGSGHKSKFVELG